MDLSGGTPDISRDTAHGEQFYGLYIWSLWWCPMGHQMCHHTWHIERLQTGPSLIGQTRRIPCNTEVTSDTQQDQRSTTGRSNGHLTWCIQWSTRHVRCIVAYCHPDIFSERSLTRIQHQTCPMHDQTCPVSMQSVQNCGNGQFGNGAIYKPPTSLIKNKCPTLCILIPSKLQSLCNPSLCESKCLV